MKNLFIASLVVAGLVACQQRSSTSAGEQTAATDKGIHAPSDSTDFTTVQWIDSTYEDLGTVAEGPEVDIAFKFKNTGNKNLIIREVTAGCGCTIVEKPQEPFPPGQVGTIRAKFTTNGHTGPNEKSINVVSNAKGNPNQELRFHIVVEKSKS